MTAVCIYFSISIYYWTSLEKIKQNYKQWTHQCFNLNKREVLNGLMDQIVKFPISVSFLTLFCLCCKDDCFSGNSCYAIMAIVWCIHTYNTHFRQPAPKLTWRITSKEATEFRDSRTFAREVSKNDDPVTNSHSFQPCL